MSPLRQIWRELQDSGTAQIGSGQIAVNSDADQGVDEDGRVGNTHTMPASVRRTVGVDNLRGRDTRKSLWPLGA